MEIMEKRNKNCPVCGTIGERHMELNLHNCRTCGTVYNKFSVIYSEAEDENTNWN